MDSSTKKLHDMIQRMIELDTPEQQKQKLDEMTSMNISMSGETADDVASLMKLLGNAGMSEPEAQGPETPPMRQDMERLATIMGGSEGGMHEEACHCCGEMHEGACVDESEDVCSCCGKPHGAAHEELEEWSRTDASELEQLYNKVKAAMKGDRRAASDFASYVSKNYGEDGARLLKKIGKLDSRDQTKTLQDLVRSRKGGDEYGTADQGIRRNQMQFNGYDNEPDADYQDTEYMTKDISGGLNRQKKSYTDAEDGDNPMAVESVKDRLYRQLAEKKKADKDYDGDGEIESPKDEYWGSKKKAAKKKGKWEK